MRVVPGAGLTQPPPQHGAPGQRPALDRRWLAYLEADGDRGDPADLVASELLANGCAEFNSGSFFASHETWEELWGRTAYPQRLFCLALTKLGAGFEHARRANARGATRLLTDALAYLAPFLSAYAGLDTQRLHDDVREWLRASGSGAVRYPRIRRVPSSSPPTGDGV